ncbi:hypothetical protein [Cryobacterium sp. CG_9.6]|uniref:hypothetical protein n=1 Tax=Cryobacterium sp. CG_9.6 TaxID=2760710 RepID=UPI0024736841|nr:hypothetical protein [Cryobacterium sp. CG_9.6]MDH6236350.1 hypothetical protein [Cryobacterium sp. CG_9.6]
MNTTSIVTDNSAWWFALAIITAGLAETKGRRRWFWFVLGLLFGPLATALVVVWAPLSPLSKPFVR